MISTLPTAASRLRARAISQIATAKESAEASTRAAVGAVSSLSSPMSLKLPPWPTRAISQLAATPVPACARASRAEVLLTVADVVYISAALAPAHDIEWGKKFRAFGKEQTWAAV